MQNTVGLNIVWFSWNMTTKMVHSIKFVDFKVIAYSFGRTKDIYALGNKYSLAPKKDLSHSEETRSVC